MKVIILEKREMVIAAKQRGEAIKEISKWVGICPKSVYNIWQIYMKNGDVKPKIPIGKISKIGMEKLYYTQMNFKSKVFLQKVIKKLICKKTFMSYLFFSIC